MSETRIKLPELSRRLLAKYGTTRPYGRLYRAALNGEFPVTQDENSGRYSIDEADLPTVAKALGLNEKAAA